MRNSNIMLSCIIGIISELSKIKLAIWIKTICEGVYHFMWNRSTPLNFALHQPSCNVIMHHIAHCTCIDLCYTFPCMCFWFFSSRRRRRAVRAGVRAPSGGSCLCFYRWSDRRAHLFTYFTVSYSLFSCYPYVAILLCHASFSTCLPIWAVLPFRYLLPVVCWLTSLASRSALLGFVVISKCLRCCWEVDTWDTF